MIPPSWRRTTLLALVVLALGAVFVEAAPIPTPIATPTVSPSTQNSFQSAASQASTPSTTPSPTNTNQGSASSTATLQSDISSSVMGSSSMAQTTGPTSGSLAATASTSTPTHSHKLAASKSANSTHSHSSRVHTHKPTPTGIPKHHSHKAMAGANIVSNPVPGSKWEEIRKILLIPLCIVTALTFMGGVSLYAAATYGSGEGWFGRPVGGEDDEGMPGKGEKLGSKRIVKFPDVKFTALTRCFKRPKEGSEADRGMPAKGAKLGWLKRPARGQVDATMPGKGWRLGRKPKDRFADDKFTPRTRRERRNLSARLRQNKPL